MMLLVRRARALMLLAAALAAQPVLAQLATSGAPPGVKGWKAVTVAEGVAQPWGMAWLADGKLLVTSKEGRLHVLNGSKFDTVALEGLPKVYTGGQGGLLDIAVHPRDQARPRIYMTMATGDDQANRTILVQGVWDGKGVTGIKTLFQVRHAKSGGQHFGARIVFLADGSLLMSVGDGGNQPARIDDRLARDQAQNLASHHGAILHLSDSGKAAAGNPLAARPNALPELWTKGHRNVQGMAIDAAGRVWATEHGPRGGDELNLIVGGQNYGWPLQSYGADYGSNVPIGMPVVAGMTQPLVAWVPSPAPSGLAYYTGSHFPQWQGSLFSGSLAAADVRRIGLDKDGKVGQIERLEIGKRVRDVRQGPDGYLYLLTDEVKGKLLRIIPE